MKILAFAGSSSSSSINRELVKYCLRYFTTNDVSLIDLNDFEMPLFSIDEEKKKGFPEAAHQFIKEIESCDLIICSLAEHNRSYTTVFKNIFDWLTRINIKPFQNKKKKMFLMTTSPGGFGGKNVMDTARNVFPQFGAEIIAYFLLPKFYENYDLENGIINIYRITTRVYIRNTKCKRQNLTNNCQQAN
ncbi:NADPH-dependent FMN reductase [Pedobacter sp. NJ-S-72]